MVRFKYYYKEGGFSNRYSLYALPNTGEWDFLLPEYAERITRAECRKLARPFSKHLQDYRSFIGFYLSGSEYRDEFRKEEAQMVLEMELEEHKAKQNPPTIPGNTFEVIGI